MPPAETPNFTPDPAQLSDRSTWHDQFGDEESLARLRAICLPYPEAQEDRCRPPTRPTLHPTRRS